jgi:hypothetical protein
MTGLSAGDADTAASVPDIRAVTVTTGLSAWDADTAASVPDIRAVTVMAGCSETLAHAAATGHAPREAAGEPHLCDDQRCR